METSADNLAVMEHLIIDDDLVLYILGGCGLEYDVVVVLGTDTSESISLVDLHGLFFFYNLILHPKRGQHSSTIIGPK